MSDTDIETEDFEAPPPEEFELPFTALADRLDKVLARLMPQHSRSRLQAWIDEGHVRINGQAARVRAKAGPGDRIQVWPQPAPEAMAFIAEAVEFRVVGEGADWIVIDKPAGLVTHPGAGNWHGTLLNGLLHRYPELARVARAGIVHRLDKDTSGLLVVARNEIAQTHLVRQLQARSVKREYLALVHGWPDPEGTVDLAIGRDARVPVRMSAQHPIAPKPAVTHYRTLGRGHAGPAPVAEMACRLETGRTHQIRVHMASLRHPLLGDTVYGGAALAGAARQMLHARALSFQDPASGEWLAFEACAPADFMAVRAAIQWQS
ncbi:RluA family pseudouridine synthase [Castellaniella sp. GW247-6E4]|uniref:RluA family pseudouridine synthase n=1 Tax=Castellaniella sp. GW247-6E4 TaxID=3140380 RepID=UPI0033162982